MIREALGIALFPVAVFLAGVTWTLARQLRIAAPQQPRKQPENAPEVSR